MADALVYDSPATSWLEALPLGNGALGAMCWGGVDSVRFDLNDETAWSGSPRSEVLQAGVGADAARELLAEARSLLREGRSVDAERPLQRMQSAYTQAYLPLASAELRLTLPTTGNTAGEATAYRRRLDLGDAVHRVEYVAGGASVTHRTIVSAVHGVLMHVIDGLPAGTTVEVLLTSSLRRLAPEQGDGALLLRLPSDVAPSHEAAYPAATWAEGPGASLEAAVVARVHTDTAPDGQPRHVLFLASETTFCGLGRQPEGTATDARRTADIRVSAAIDAGVDSVLEAHVSDYRGLFDRVKLNFGPAEGASRDDVLTDRRVREAAASPRGPLAADPALAALLFDYGRYLLISSSRPGGLPATLQGIWNDSLQPPWSSNYTTNINLQMNYWSAEVANLPETAEPLVDFIEALANAGAATAKRLYGARGWVAHHNSDAWLYTSPVGDGHGDPAWAFWPMAGPWLVRHLWDRVEFGTADDTFIAERAWPLIRSQAEFVLDWMVPHGDGSWGTSPSTSPENTFLSAQGPASLGRSTAMDLALVRELFTTAIAAAQRLGLTDDTVIGEIRERLPHLPAVPQANSDGGVREWFDDVKAIDPHHRHLSPLYFVYPGTTALKPDDRDAAIASLEQRGDDSTGWSLAWKLALWSRLHRPDKVSDLLRLFFRPADAVTGPWAGGLYPNLFAAHPPFQIDGNLGYVAALSESLLQSHGAAIELLPALPSELSTGQLDGLVARPGVLVGLVWQDGALVEARLRARSSRKSVTVTYRGHELHRTVETDVDSVLTAVEFAEAPVGRN